jgi:hypothetical protein
VGTLTVIGNATIGGNATVTGNVSMNVATITTANVTTTNTSSLVVTGNQTFVGTGNRITGDFSNATIASRVSFQTSTVNGNTGIFVLPNGTSTNANFAVVNNSDPTNSAYMQMRVGSATSDLISGVAGTGTYLPMTFITGGSERARIDTSGNVGIGTSSPATNLNISSASAATGGDGIQYVQATYTGTGTVNAGYTAKNYYGTSQFFQWNNNGTRLGNRIITNAGGGVLVFTYGNDTEGMRITSAGDVGIGTSSPVTALSVSGAFSFTAIASVPAVGSSFFAPAANTLAFGTASTERMRIDSAGNVYIETGLLWQYAPTPTTKAAVATLTAAELATDIITLTGTTYTITLPTGTALDTYYTGVPAVNIGYDFHIVNTASGIITIAVGASGMTSVGLLTVAATVSAHFRLRRTAANTYILYRLS